MALGWLRTKRARNLAIYGTEWLDEMAAAERKLRPAQACILAAIALGAIVRPSLDAGPIWAEVVIFILAAAGLVFLARYTRAMRAAWRHARERRLAWQHDHPSA